MAGAQSHVELVNLNVLLQVAIGTGAGQLDALIGAFPIQRGVLQEVGVTGLEDQVIR